MTKLSLLTSFDRQTYSQWKKIKRWGKFVWIDTGLDGNDLDHQRLTAKLIKHYGKIDLLRWKINIIEYNKLRITWYIHDIPEYLDWDTNYEEKNNKDTNSDYKSWRKMIQKILKWDPEKIEEAEEIYKIDTDPTHQLYKIFKIYERIWYIYGAILAFGLNSHEEKNLHWLCNNVIGHQLDILIHASKEYHSVKLFLNDFSDKITWIIQLWSLYSEENNKFNEASSSWHEYNQKNPQS